MQSVSDDFQWLLEPRALALCGLPRSTFQSWCRAGLDLRDPGGAYGESDVLRLVVLIVVREYLGLAETVGAWKALESTGEAQDLVTRARMLEPDDRFDVVLEPEHASIAVVHDDAELVAAVRHPGAPRPVVVVDAAERLMHARDSFRRLAQAGARPNVRRRGRPRTVATVTELGGGAR